MQNYYLFSTHQHLCTEWYKNMHYAMNVDYTVFLNVFSYNHMASAMRSTLSEFCFCGCHWTSSNTACDNCVAPVSRALPVSLAGSASCWWLHRHSATRGVCKFFGRPLASGQFMHAAAGATWLFPGAVACSSGQCWRIGPAGTVRRAPWKCCQMGP